MMRKILVVEDDPDDLQLYAEAFALEVPHLYLETAVSPARALEKMLDAVQRTDPFALMIIDGEWSGGSPAHLLRTIRADARLDQLMVAVMSPKITGELKRVYRRLGVKHFLLKPDDLTSFRRFARTVTSTIPISRLLSVPETASVIDGRPFIADSIL